MAENKRYEQDGGGRPPGGAPAVSLPKGGGAIRGIGETFAANPASGTGTFTVPLPLSPGRSGFGPRLDLTYDSGAGNGPFGYGWSLSLPYISRKTEKGLPVYRDEAESDVYVLAGAEDLVPVREADDSGLAAAAGTEGYRIDRYRPRTETEYARIERWTRLDSGAIHWRAVSRDNVTSVYGGTAQSRISDPADPDRRTFSWLLCESYDDKGNAIVYEYKAEDEEGIDRMAASEQGRERPAGRYLKRVRYGNRVSRLIEPDLSAAEWLFEAVLDYGEGHAEAFDPEPERPADAKHRYVRATADERGSWTSRPDPFSEYRAGFEVRTHRRCRRVLMFHCFPELGGVPCLVRAAEFGYEDFEYGRDYTAEEELAHPGSSRFASFLRSVTQTGYVRQQALETDEDGRCVYLRKSYPPLELEYGKAVILEETRELDADSAANLPAGADGAHYRWADLEGNGLTGVLTKQADAWYYKPNLGGGRLGPLEPVSPLPAYAAAGGRQLVDLDGDGRLEWASFGGVTPGYSARRADGSWEPDRPFVSLPNLDWDDPNLRFADLDGDGRADILITERDAIVWHPSLGTDGFGPASRTAGFDDEERGPRLELADGEQSVYLADMSGDGLADLVRIRNGEVWYRPNLDYGRFGARVAMDDAPWFDYPDQFDRSRIRLADLDGSGTTDIVYAGQAGIALYFNQSGNRWSGPYRLGLSIPADAALDVVDLLGTGTACLVWSAPRPAEGESAIKYADLLGGRKPNLLTGIANNLGTETKLSYAPSTKYYAEDAVAGRPWPTKLPFPVQTLERTETYDRVSGSRFVTRYAYHDGFYDGIEREFRGFALVEQWDTEEYAEAAENDTFRRVTNADSYTSLPPALTKTWYHTGDCGSRSRLFGHTAPAVGGEGRPLLDDVDLPSDWAEEERREAYRALRGMPLRQEIYALDGTEREGLAYLVREHSYAVRCLQRKGSGRHGVFDVHPRETVVVRSERGASDPRIEHELALATDAYGNVLKAAAVAYGRAEPDPELNAQDQEFQGETKLVYTEHEYTNAAETAGGYRAPLPFATRRYELTGPVLRTAGRRLTFAEAAEACAEAAVLAPEASPDTIALQKRLLTETRTRYRRDDLSGPLPFGKLEAGAIPYESYRLAFTPGLLDVVYGGWAAHELLEDEGRYVRLEGDERWWAPSGLTFYSPKTEDTPERELAEAKAHFYAIRRYRDPYHTEAFPTEVAVRYDRYDLLLLETTDALGNRVSVLETDYRALQPACVADQNGNRSAVRFDALGLVTGTAVMGKTGDAPREGDSLDGFAADLTEAETLAYLRAPAERAHELLGSATTRLVYDWFAYLRTRSELWPEPAAISTLARETHDAELKAGERTAIQRSFAYYDGFGREIQKKLAAEPGPVPKRDPDTGAIVLENGRPAMNAEDAPVRWVGDGWTVYNNKGLPVRRYEPFFTDTHRYERDVRVGVSTLRMYDPLGREVAALHPDHTWEKVVFDTWSQRTYT
ncbi:SpvB/TcaC N-terminal domain-containing protein, partial [Cohnella sp. GbtcB17]|uniref:SpvB/TcaC N-terminal domain-containing protein n=1 Tax=Cohnella sp. GbtcB17 TaxID=2824762 RepID=UPI0027D33411